MVTDTRSTPTSGQVGWLCHLEDGSRHFIWKDRNEAEEMAWIKKRYVRWEPLFVRSESAAIPESVWIMAADRLPAHGENVLFLTSAGSWFGWLDANNGDGTQWRDHFEDELICTTLEVLCWMPVPEAPKKFTVSGARINR